MVEKVFSAALVPGLLRYAVASLAMTGDHWVNFSPRFAMTGD